MQICLLDADFSAQIVDFSSRAVEVGRKIWRNGQLLRYTSEQKTILKWA